MTFLPFENNPHFLHNAGRNFSFILLLVVGLWLLVIPAAAHAPSDMEVSSHEISRTLFVTITHNVQNPQNHYIREVLVTINGRTVNDSFYTSQPDSGTFTSTYPVDTKPGDEITVTATCVLNGSLSRTLYNTGPVATIPQGGGAAPSMARADAGLLPLAGLAMYIGYRKLSIL